jgi:hypothetical protein
MSLIATQYKVGDRVIFIGGYFTTFSSARRFQGPRFIEKIQTTNLTQYYIITHNNRACCYWDDDLKAAPFESNVEAKMLLKR